MFLRLKNSYLLKNISKVLFWNQIVNFISIVISVIIIRELTKEDYALYTFYLSTLAIFSGIVSNGITTAYVRFASEEYSSKGKIPNELFLFSLLICFVFFLILSPFLFIYKNQLSILLFKKVSFNNSLLFAFAASILFFIIQIISKYYEAKDSFHVAGIIRSLRKFLFFLCIIVVLVFSKLNFNKVIYLELISVLFICVLLSVKLISDKFIIEKINLSYCFAFLTASLWLILYSLLISLQVKIDIFIISRLSTMEDLANYGVSMKYYSIVIILLPAIKTVLRVRTSKIDMVNNINKQMIFVKKWLKFSFLIVIPLLFIVFFFSEPVLIFLNGPDYNASIVPFKLLCVSAIFSYVFSPITTVLVSMKKYRQICVIAAMGLAISFFANLYFIPHYGIIGSAIVHMCSFALTNIFSTIYVFLITISGSYLKKPL